MTFIAVDPGGAVLAWAVFRDGVLVACGLHRTKEKDTFARAQVHRGFVDTLKELYETNIVVSEAMWYAKRRGARPQDIINLNLIAGAVATEWVLPHAWKGMVAKEIHQPWVWAELQESEKEIVRAVKPDYLRHNAVDAVGIGLWRLRRLVPCSRKKRDLVASPRKRSSVSGAATKAASPTSPRKSGIASRSRSSERRGIVVTRAVSAWRQSREKAGCWRE
jgi:hypothetical protein